MESSGSLKINLVNKQEESRSYSSSFTSGLLISTSVSVAGSFCYGCALSYSSPAQSKIMEELGLSVADYSFFTSVMTLGGLITAAFSGKIAALVGRRQAMYGRDHELEVTLKRLRGENANILEEAAEIRETVEMSKRETQSGVRDLFHMRNAHSIIIGLGLMLLQQFCGSSAISAYASQIFNQAGFPSDIGTTILAAILISSIGLCICTFLIGLSYYLQKHGEFQKLCSVMLIVGLMGYGAVFGIGLGGIPWIIMSEVFPVNVKVTAGSLVTVSNWFFSWIIIYSFNFMMQWSTSGTFFTFSGVSLLTIIFVWILVPETKDRTLEEIQASLVQLL